MTDRPRPPRRRRRRGIARALALAAAGIAASGACVSSGGGAPDTQGPSATATSVTTTSTTAEPGSPGPGALPAGEDTRVVRVSDGDTIVVDGNSRVRLIGIDTPETQDPRVPVECFGAEASRQTRALLPEGERVRLVYDVERTDRYGRTLAYVYRRSDGLFVNLALVRDGFAAIATYPPNVAHVEDFRAAEREAREAGRGLWAGCPTAAPSATSTSAPAAAVAPVPGPGGGACDAAYPDVCIPPAPPDLDCRDVAERGFRVIPPDPHRFDGNGDGVGCE